MFYGYRRSAGCCWRRLFSAVWVVAGPSLQALVSRNVSATEQGAVQGALTSINGIASILGPLLFTALFTYFTAIKHPSNCPAPLPNKLLLVAIAACLATITAKRRG